MPRPSHAVSTESGDADLANVSKEEYPHMARPPKSSSTRRQSRGTNASDSVYERNDRRERDATEVEVVEKV